MLALVVLVLAMPAACTSPGPAEGQTSLTVFAASSLTEAFTEIARDYERANPNVAVALNFSGSQRLRVQLEHGAQADVFASADEYQMDLAKGSGLLAGEAIYFASNSLVAVAFRPETKGPTHSGTPAGAGSGEAPGQIVRSLQDLAGQGVKLALAQPEVPAGAYTREAIASLASEPGFGPEWLSGVTENIVSLEPNVRNVLQKVSLGEVDAGFVYVSDVSAAPGLAVIPVPAQSNVVAKYPIVTLKEAANPTAADGFIDFVTSSEGQAILGRYGFGPSSNLGNSRRPAGSGAALVKQSPRVSPAPATDTGKRRLTWLGS